MMWLAGLLVSQNGIPVPKESTEVIHAGKVKPCCTQCHVSVDDCRSNSACMATIGASMAAEMICLGYSNWLGLISLYSSHSHHSNQDFSVTHLPLGLAMLPSKLDVSKNVQESKEIEQPCRISWRCVHPILLSAGNFTYFEKMMFHDRVQLPEGAGVRSAFADSISRLKTRFCQVRCSQIAILWSPIPILPRYRIRLSFFCNPNSIHQ